ncbi:MAG: TetR family transcriptional regulator [Dermatophilaceae bacterium]
MSSGEAVRRRRPTPDADLTALARIRLAAIEQFAARGFAHTTVRGIAERAGVSAALILHHFASKDGLRAACDEHVLQFVREGKTAVFTTGTAPRIAAYLEENPEVRPLLDYMTRVLAEGGPTAQAMFERMVADVRGYLAAGEAAGTVRPTADEQARAVLNAAFSVTLLLLGPLVARELGGEQLLDQQVLTRYTTATYELYAHGLLTGKLADFADRQLDELPPPAHREHHAADTQRTPRAHHAPLPQDNQEWGR